ncbi:myb-like protein X [Vespula maculifrons]|uniref:Myb-like protein X n=1 Tax=Vespula maculifrons TaxID=7453 RepID=A0ABD2AH85_VESMC
MMINNDSKRKNLGIKAEDEEEVEGVTGDEEVDGDGEFNSNETDDGLLPNIDFAILDLNSNVPNAVYRKDEVEWIILILRE